MTVISLENVKITFKNNMLFSCINLSIEAGQIYGITGPNGSGKSVLFKVICGFIFPNSGVVKINGVALNKSKKRFPEDFGIIIDRPGFIGNKTGYENLEALAAIKGEIQSDKIKETMDMVGLDFKVDQKVNNYSLGMRQKLAIAQAIMENQKILILDEPFNALDVDSVEKIRKLLISLKNEGKTILITSHNQSDIEYLCDHVYRINNYKLQYVN